MPSVVQKRKVGRYRNGTVQRSQLSNPVVDDEVEKKVEDAEEVERIVKSRGDE